MLEHLISKHGLRRVVHLLAQMAHDESDACLVKRDHVTAARWAHSYNILKRAAHHMRG